MALNIYKRKWRDKKTGLWIESTNWSIEFTYNGKRYREVAGPNEKLAKDVLAKRQVEIRENRFFPDKQKEPDPVKFYDFCKEYLAYSKTNKKASTYRDDFHIARRLNKEFEKKPIQEITTWQLEKWKAKRKEEVKPATVNRELAFLKNFFTKAVEWGKCKESPARKVKLLKGEVKRVRFLMPDEVQNLLSNCSDYIKPLVTVSVHTGLRKGELLALQWPQINFEQGIIAVLDTKNHERRDIPMNETVKEILRSTEKKGDFVFCDQGGCNWEILKIHRAFREAVEASKIDDFRWHDIRHCFASNLVMAGEDLNTIRELMGHKNMSMTLRYAHLAPNYKKKAVTILDKIFGQKLPQQESTEKVVSIRG